MLKIQDYIGYNKLTGIFTRKLTTSSRAISGSVCNTKNKQGYVVFYVNKKLYLGHRLAWEIIYGEIPNKMEVDHINRIKNDNRIENLRIVTSSENSRNLPISKRNNSGIVGVSWYASRDKWRATIMDNNRQIHLGYFQNKEDAILARKQAEIKYEYHINHGL